MSTQVSRRTALRAGGLAALGGLAPAVAGCTEPSSASQGDLVLWTFASTHAGWFTAMAAEYLKKTGIRVSVQLITGNISDQLLIDLKAGGHGAPDLTDIEQGSFGSFLIGQKVPLVDLGPRLRAKGYDKQLVASRQALYSWQGKVYGVEHALTPVTLFYLHEPWRKAGIDPATLATWDDFIKASQDVFHGDTHAIPIPAHEYMLRQRGGDYFDADGNVAIDSDLSVDTMEWMLSLRSKYKVALRPPGNADWAAVSTNPSMWNAFRTGRLTAFPVPDWYAGTIASEASDLVGKWRAAPLPAFEKGGTPTSCGGGTGLTILETSRKQDQAWDFLEFSMLRVPAVVAEYKAINLWPAYIPAWSDPGMHAPIPFFGGQDIGALYSEVGRRVPPQYQSPFRPLLNQEVSPRMLDVFQEKRKASSVFGEIADVVRARQKRGGAVG